MTRRIASPWTMPAQVSVIVLHALNVPATQLSSSRAPLRTSVPFGKPQAFFGSVMVPVTLAAVKSDGAFDAWD